LVYLFMKKIKANDEFMYDFLRMAVNVLFGGYTEDDTQLR